MMPPQTERADRVGNPRAPPAGETGSEPGSAEPRLEPLSLPQTHLDQQNLCRRSGVPSFLMIVSARQWWRHTALWWRATVMKQTSKLVLDQNYNPETFSRNHLFKIRTVNFSDKDQEIRNKQQNQDTDWKPTSPDWKPTSPSVIPSNLSGFCCVCGVLPEPPSLLFFFCAS